MGTRSTTWFHDANQEEPVAKVYRDSDGYPESMLPDLEQFFADVEAQTKHARFGDPAYLAAKWVVWLADQFAYSFEFVGTGFERKKTRMLDFLGVSVVLEDPPDIEFRYHVRCGNGRPKVTWEEV